MKEEIKFKDLKIGDIFMSSDDTLDKNGLYMKVHMFDFKQTISENKCLNLHTGNVFTINPEIKVLIKDRRHIRGNRRLLCLWE